MTHDFLNKIVAHKKSLLPSKKAFFNEWQPSVKSTRMHRYGLFRKHISAPGKINLIAEIKKASPSRGLIRDDFHALQIAAIYAAHGAAALSVVTEEKFFLGKLTYLRDIAAQSPVPVLRKDFIIDKVQIYEAFYYGASAVLLIAAILSDQQVEELTETARQLDMDCLLEVHNEKELTRALNLPAPIIGINNRDLNTFKIDLAVSEKLIPMIPRDRTIVVESGIREHADILRFEHLGANAVLIGEAFMQAKDIAGRMDEVMKGCSHGQRSG